MRYFLSLMLLKPAAAQVPKAWDETALRDWATPLAGLGVRPGHFPEAEYYKAPVENLRTYPVYLHDREPAGYWEMLSKAGPQPLIERDRIKTDVDWTAAGKRVFAELDVVAFRSWDAKLISTVRSPEYSKKPGLTSRRDGTIGGLRWVPTEKGVALSLADCSGCHTRLMPDGSTVDGPPSNEDAGPAVGALARFGLATVPLPGDTPPQMIWRGAAVPWIADDIHAKILTMPKDDLRALVRGAVAEGIFPRWNGSPYYPTKIPDLIGIKDRKYIDHTATHQHRGPGDIMRYAVVVSYADVGDFGSHKMFTDEQRRIQRRPLDEALYALTMYIYSLKAPDNPNAFDTAAAEGQKVFRRQGCTGCHTPPLYTNNKLTLAVGFTPPKDQMKFLDILPVSVGTDPDLALKTRKGTGYYKVPSLKGVWYRGHFLHDGSLTTLEEMFNPDRLRDDFVPTGFVGFKLKTRAVKGHEFALSLPSKEKQALIAFLKTL
jgi:mono/diheme cytochrome c family protein